MGVCTGTIAGMVAALTLAASEPVTIGTDGPFPEYIYIDAAGTITGFDRDLVDEVCTRAALRCEWELANFDELIPGVASGQFDVVVGGIAVTEERRQLVDFTQSYYATDPEEWYIGRPDAPPPEKAMTAVQSGTLHEAHLRRMGYRFTTYATEPEVLVALVEGRADLALGPFQTRDDLASYFAANAITHRYSELIPDEGVALAVCKGNPLLDTLNAALDSMRADGTLTALETRWFH